MTVTRPPLLDLRPLQELFGERLEPAARLARYTAVRIGGAADALVRVSSLSALIEAVSALWRLEAPFCILGGGSNVLISDAGLRGVVILNRARRVRFDEQAEPPTVWAESGANLGAVARQAAGRGLGGLEWAAGIPGTIGGAVIGNAGAHGDDTAGRLILAEILHQEAQGGALPTLEGQPAGQVRRERWPAERLEYGYRESALKRHRCEHAGRAPRAVVLAALLRLERSTPGAVRRKMDEFGAYRRCTQPPGASMGSMFKNPPGDYAGRLIEAAGLKGARLGRAEISPLHANFFVNRGGATAEEVLNLIRLARREVAEKFGVELELEIELLGFGEAEGMV